MLIPKESDQLLCSHSNPHTESENKDTADSINEKPVENVKVLIANVITPENTLVNGNINGEVKPPTTTKSMNILQNIIIKKEDHDHCIQIPIKRELDDDTLNNRIKIPRREPVETTVISSPIKQEVLDIKSEVIEAASSNTIDSEAASESKTEVHTCFRCNMIFMEKKAYTIHSKRCGKNEVNYTPEDVQSSSCNNSANNQCSRKTNYLQHLEQLPRLIESIRTTECLYNTNIEGYNNIDLKDQMWSRIAANCNFVSGKIAKGTWKKLLQEFCESLSKRQSGTITEPYRFEQQMQFILPYINSVKQPSNIHNNNYTNNYSSHATFTNVTIPNEIIEDVDDAQSIIHVATPTKRQRITTPYVIRQTERESPLPLPPPSGRALDLLFMSMCESVKALPFHLQLQVKKKVFDAVLEAEEIVNRVNRIRNEPFSPPPTPGEDFQY